MGESKLLVVEVGGTTLRAALFDSVTRTLSQRRATSTPSVSSAGFNLDIHREVFDAIGRLSNEVTPHDPDVVAIAYPGPMNRDGVVLAAPTVAGGHVAHSFSLNDMCAALWPTAKVHVFNDLTAAGYRLVANGLRNFAVVTVGSGIGHKVFLDGRACVGVNGRGGEIGHLRLDFSSDAPRCDCGCYGHLGALASGRGTVALARRLGAADEGGWQRSLLSRLVSDPAAISGPALASAYRDGDPFATGVITTAVRYLGQALAAIHLDTGVERIVLMGGFARALGESYRDHVVLAAEAATWPLGQAWQEIVQLGPPDDDSALLGAGLAATGAIGVDGG